MQINQENIELFYEFINERQNIWVNRFVKKLPRSSWTNDEILKRYKFTNVYRILDPGTEYVIKNILGKGSNEEVFFNIIVYRIFNRIETYEQIGYIKLSDYYEGYIFDKLKKYREEGNPVFTSAFMVTGVRFAGSDDKVVNYEYIIKCIYDKLKNLYVMCNEAKKMEWAHISLCREKGISDFLAYQIMLDCMYGKILSFDEDTSNWTIAGNGARRGLNYVFNNLRKEEELDAMIHLRDEQERYFSVFDIDYQHLHYFRKDYKYKYISLSNIENCLCEFSKYMKVKKGEGRPRVKFVPTKRDGDKDGIL